MAALLTLHRWAGGIAGALLGLLGLTGTLLLYRETWLRWTLPHAADPLRPADAPAAVARAFADPANRDATIVLADDGLGVHRVIARGGEAGAYLDQSGAVVTGWTTLHERPELWLFDLHRRLLSGAVGETVVGCIGILGLLFVVTGTLLWWRTRRTFAPRPLPKRLTRPAIARHHRDLGILVAPLLVVSFATGAVMALKPVGSAVLTLGRGDDGLSLLRSKPQGAFGPIALDLDWAQVVRTAESAVPGAVPRVVAPPAKPGAPIVVRMRTPDDWLPSGSVSVWLDPATGHVVRVVRPTRASRAAWIATREYPIHAGKAGRPVWRAALTASGFALTLLGSLAVASFWTGRFGRRRGRAGGRRVRG